MSFENFYEESDKADRRGRWLIYGMLLSPFFSFILIALFSWYEVREAEIVVNLQSERERQVDALCMSLPKPEQFNLIKRESPMNSADIASITFRFRSERGLDEIMPTFRLWFDANGWTADADWKSRYSKDNQSILIQPSEIYTEIFEISCYERAPNSLSFEIYD